MNSPLRALGVARPSACEANLESLSRSRAAQAAARRSVALRHGTRPSSRRRHGRRRGHDDIRRPSRCDAGRRHHAARRAAAQVDHARRRGRGRGHRGVVVSLRTRARHDQRDRGADRRWPGPGLHAGQRASRPLPCVAELVWHARLRAETDGAHHAGQAPRAHRASQPWRSRRVLRRTGPAVRRARNRFSRWRRLCPRCAGRAVGRFVETAPYASDYTFERIYFRSLRERKTDYLATRDYLWRWDTDWFWCSQNLGLQRRWLRRLVGRRRLNSIFYQKIMRWNSRWKVTAAWDRLRGLHAESVIQDVDIPLARAAEFLDFLHAQIGIVPIWICPIRAPRESVISAVSADARRHIRQFRILGQRQNPAGASCRLSQPQDRAQGARARRHQVALFRFVFHARGILGDLQPADV